MIRRVSSGFILRSLLLSLISTWAFAQRSSFSTENLIAVESLGQASTAKDDRLAKVDWPLVVRQAKGGDLEAQYRLALCYQRGGPCRRNWVRAVRWYRQAAEAGHPLAANNLALCYAGGVGGLPKDDAVAVEWLWRAAMMGEPVAEINLYVHYANGWGVDRNLPYALTLLTSAARKGAPEAQIEWAKRLMAGDGFERDLDRARELLRRATESGDDLAPELLGRSFEEAGEVDVALSWYRLAADRGNPGAMGHLGSLILNGADDLDEGKRVSALEWVRKAADLGDVDSKRRLAQWHSEGRFVDRSLFHAVRLFREVGLSGDVDALDRAAAIHEQDYPEEAFFSDLFDWNLKRAGRGELPAKLALVLQYRDGLGTKPDEKEAFRWLRSAAEQGNPKAQYWLGLVYEEGKWIEQDLSRSFYWYNLAAQADVTPARYKVGHAYAFGIGVEKDSRKAVYWLRLAASDQLLDAEKLLKQIEGNS